MSDILFLIKHTEEKSFIFFIIVRNSILFPFVSYIISVRILYMRFFFAHALCFLSSFCSCLCQTFLFPTKKECRRQKVQRRLTVEHTHTIGAYKEKKSLSMSVCYTTLRRFFPSHFFFPNRIAEGNLGNMHIEALYTPL